MDYEKKYKEASERFKAWREKYLTKETAFGDVIYDKTGEMQAEFNAIFPELAESEDERIRQSLLAYIKGESKRLDTKKWIAYLEKQKEQKPRWEINTPHTTNWTKEMIDEKFEELVEQRPAEWSKEDEAMRADILDSLRRYQLSMPNYQVELQMRWLKSLRPSWKPSEEQMEALNTLNCHGGLSYIGQQNLLISLYNDLKKLK